MKDPRAPRACLRALDPGLLGLTAFAQLCCVKLAKRSKIFGLGPPLQKAGYGPAMLLYISILLELLLAISENSTL